MKRFLRLAAKFVLYSSATLVILLAVAVGLFRLFLPRLPVYQDEIKSWASTAIGMQVEFSGMDARWGLRGPELEFYDAELIRTQTGVRVIAADEVRIGVGLMRLLRDRTLVVDRLVIRESAVDVRQMEDGSFRFQGTPLDELLGMRPANADTPGSFSVVGEALTIRYLRPGDARPTVFRIPELQVHSNDRRITVDADIRLDESLGSEISITAMQLHDRSVDERSWDITVDSDDLLLPGWSALLDQQRSVTSGTGDLQAALAITGKEIRSASIDMNLRGVALGTVESFDIAGHFELAQDSDGWLLAGRDVYLGFVDHEWPVSTLRVEAATDDNGEVVMLDAVASYLRLADVRYVLPWLSESQQSVVNSLDPSGNVQDAVLTVSDFDTERPRYTVSATLEDVGLAAANKRPGLRGFSGTVRASHTGGSLEIAPSSMQIDAAAYFDETIPLETPGAMVFWRWRDGEFLLWSDGLQLSNDVFGSNSDIDLVFRQDERLPSVNISSMFSIADVATAKRWIPRHLVKPRLYEWFQAALVRGAIPSGTAVLQGQLADFPFDDGDGQLLINASVRDLEFRYHPDWPAASRADIEVVLENTRLYSTQNRSNSAGIVVANANVDIPNLRKPVLEIRSSSTAPLEAIRQFSLQSPIAQVFGGQLERISVDGDASFNLDLSVPLQRDRVRDFEFTSRIRGNGGSLRVAGFPAPVTDLTGEVTISRDSLSAESLTGTFLGEPVDIDLQKSAEAGVSVVALATGMIESAGLVDGLGVPLDGLLDGRTAYSMRLDFPDNKSEQSKPFTVSLTTALEGFELRLPSPLGKDALVAMPTAAEIRFPAGGEVIETSGSSGDDIRWNGEFHRDGDGWDFDRGVLTFDGSEPGAANTRGLHIRGSAAVVRLDEWLALSRREERNIGAADRIRSIDVVVDDLYILGQRLRGHRVRVDRSARDWLVQFDGSEIAGSVFVPYDFAGDRPMVLDMARLRLPGDDSGEQQPATTDYNPEKLPAIELRAEEFALGERNLGSLEVLLAKADGGLQAASIKSSDASFEIAGTGRWIRDPGDVRGSRSSLSAVLVSRNVQATMQRLNYEPGIDSDNMRVRFDVEWSGSPRADLFDSLDGNVSVTFGDGQLEEVEPGAGRMFGLMSIAALPRRLSLDFRDVFSKGFGFDKISGTFRIRDGVTYTCDLALEGPAANVGIVGMADINARRYDQAAVVSANVGNTLPIVGAVVAGPQVAAALLIFSQIFRKPLQEAGQVYYGISGSWDEPAVDATNAEAFVRSSGIAGCLAEPE